MDLTGNRGEGFLQRLEEIERRLTEIESRPISGTVTPGRSLRVVSASNLDIVVMGPQTDSNVGLRVNKTGTSETLLHVDDANGIRDPWLQAHWKKANDFVVITSAGFTSAYICRFELVKSIQCRFTVTISTDAATTATARVNIGGTTWDKALTTGGTFYDLEFIVAHGKTLNTGPFIVDLQVRRDTGAGNVNVYNPTSVAMGADMPPPATGWL